MKLQEKALLHALLASKGKDLLRYLPLELADELEQWQTPKALDFSKLLSQKGWAESIHFSWFCKPLQNLSPEAQQLFLSLLDAKQADDVRAMLRAREVILSRALTVNHHPVSYARFMYPFLMDELKKKVQEGVEVIDKAYLPSSELNLLLVLEKSQLLNLIDLLGIHDLSADLRQVVDKELLRKIYSALTSEQLRFLHYCSKLPVKWVSPKLSLLSWDGSKKTLQHMLHGRGLIRVGRALFDEDESLKWHLVHRLDIGRAGIIEKIFRQKQDLSLIPYFKNQILHIIKRY